MNSWELVGRFVSNKITGKPFYASLEVTHRCNADCDFCCFARTRKQPGKVGLERESYVDVLEPLNVPFVGISGGEPLLRVDLERIIRETREVNKVPAISLTTNGSKLDEARYDSLSEAGLDFLNISMDYMGVERSVSRGIRGLSDNLEAILPVIARRGGAKVGLQVILMRENIQDIPRFLELAGSLGIRISFQPYAMIRNGNRAHIPIEFDPILDAILQAKEKGVRVLNSEEGIMYMRCFLREGSVVGCKAGMRFLWITPDGRYRPCTDRPQVTFDTYAEARRFEESNRCGSCLYECRSLIEELDRTSFLGLVKRGLELRKAVL